MQKLITSLAGIYLNLLAVIAPSLAARHGVRLFCRPFRTRVKEHQRAFLDSADRFNFEYDGVTVQGYRWGDGPRNVLFVHGWQSHSFRWKAYIESLPKDEFTVYAVDAPGHGLSGGSFLNVPYYSGIIRQMIETIGKVEAVVGHSLGSFSSLFAFHQNPSLSVKKLVLMAPPGEASDFFTFYKSMLGLSDKAVRLILKRFEKDFDHPITYFSTTAFASTVTLPGLIVHDEDDKETPYHYAIQVATQWPNATLRTTKGLGHNLKSAEVIQLVTTFIKKETESQGNDRIRKSAQPVYFE